jgi:membrane protein DedA with SNARE-associated domain
VSALALGSLGSWAAHLIGAAGYPALGFLMLASPPIPSEAILPLAGFLVGKGELAFPLALAAATAGALGNACIVYAVARWGGRPLLLRAPLIRIDEAKLGRVEAWSARHGPRVVVFGRLVSVIRWLVGIPAGAGRMPLRRYVPLTAIGCMGWNSLLLGAGWMLGRNHGEAEHAAIVGSGALFAIALATAGVVVLLRSRARGRFGRTQAGPAASEGSRAHT